MKLRLGRLSGGKQKGVDALIYRDLMTLSRERAVATAYLLGGDEDLREGVSSAQDMGVRVVVLGIDTQEEANQADTLVREADEHHVFGQVDLAPYFRAAGPPQPAGQAAENHDLATIPQAVLAFTTQWMEAATHEEVQRLAAGRPVVPKELDVELLQGVEAAVGRSLREDEDARKSVRAEFWRTVLSG